MTADAVGRAVRSAFWIVVCGVLPALALFYSVVEPTGTRAIDFRGSYYVAGEAIRAGESFLPAGEFVLRGPDLLVVDYIYPPLIGLLTLPWTYVPVDAAAVAYQVLLAAALVATLLLLGVRDWRCYGLAFLWPPVTDTIATGNISILLGLAAAAVWAYRDHARLAGSVLGVSLAAKALLWPLLFWLLATSRRGAAAWGAGVAVLVFAASWAVVGFRDFTRYPELVSRFTDRQDERSFTVYALARDLGASVNVAWALWALAATAILGGCVVLAARGDEQRAFIVGLAAAIAFSPVVWLHYFALLLVCVAIARPHLAPIWFLGIPLHVVVTTGVHNGSTFETAAVLGIAGLTVALALTPQRGEGVRRYESPRTTSVISSSR